MNVSGEVQSVMICKVKIQLSLGWKLTRNPKYPNYEKVTGTEQTRN
jgi:hypothetical protein